MRVAILCAIVVGLVATMAVAAVRVGGTAARAGAPGADRSSAGETVLGPSPILPRASVKLEIAAAVAQGEIGLAEAAARYRDLQGDDPAFLDRQRGLHSGATDAELYAWNVIGHVYGILATRPAEQAATVARLEAELLHTRTTPSTPAVLR